MKSVPATALSLLTTLLATSVAHAQRVSGTVVNEQTGLPVAGAIVSAFSGRDTAAVGLTRTNGAFQLTLPVRRELTLLVRAIGLQPVRIPLSAGTDTVVAVRMTRIAFRLSPVRVSEFTSCARTQTGTANIFDVWSEVTKALESTRLVRDEKKRRFDYVLFEKLTDAATGDVRILRNDTSSWLATRPFKVTPARELASKGYIVEEQGAPLIRRGSTRTAPLLYRAPDEMVLLDESFQSTHCFWASHGDGQNQDLIGVFFIPVSGIKTNDIRGVFWIDAQSYELKRLDYVYTQIIPLPPAPRNARDTVVAVDTLYAGPAAPSLSNPEPGGILQFMRIPDGSFIIPEWSIFVNDTWSRNGVRGAPLPKPKLMKETGGLVLRITGGN